MKRPPSIIEALALDQSIDREWMNEARCASPDIPRSAFFSDRAKDVRRAKAICKHCPVIAECLNYALSVDTYDNGVWGGTSEEERRKLRKQK